MMWRNPSPMKLWGAYGTTQSAQNAGSMWTGSTAVLIPSAKTDTITAAPRGIAMSLSPMAAAMIQKLESPLGRGIVEELQSLGK